MPNEIHAATPAINDLPRLTDDEREAVESGYMALEGVPTGERPQVPEQPLQFLARIERINSLDLGLGLDALKQLCRITDVDEGGVPLELLECVRRQLQQAKNEIERLCASARQAS